MDVFHPYLVFNLGMDVLTLLTERVDDDIHKSVDLSLELKLLSFAGEGSLLFSSETIHNDPI